jgi:hypothetical protein
MPSPTFGQVHGCSLARPWPETYAIARGRAALFAKPFCLGVTPIPMQHTRASVAAYLFAVLSFASHASQDCPLIRPVGLSTQQIDAVVVNTFAQALRRPPQSLDASKTIKTLDGTDNANLTYSFAALSIGESLGFDAIRTFYDAAKAKGGNQPFDTLTLGELQSLSRSVYLQGTDSVPPEAVEGKAYTVHSVKVQAPSPSQGWRVVQCGSDRVIFQRQTPTGLSTAGTRVADLPPFESESGFLTKVSALLSSAVPRDFRVQPWLPKRVPDTSVPCVDAMLTGAGSTGTLFLRARICYADKGASFGYATLYNHISQQGDELPRALAESFVVSASPK